MITALARSENLRSDAAATIDARDELKAALEQKEVTLHKAHSDLEAQSEELKTQAEELRVQTDKNLQLRDELRKAEEKRVRDIGLALKAYRMSQEFKD